MGAPCPDWPRSRPAFQAGESYLVNLHFSSNVLSESIWKEIYFSNIGRRRQKPVVLAQYKPDFIAPPMSAVQQFSLRLTF